MKVFRFAFLLLLSVGGLRSWAIEPTMDEIVVSGYRSITQWELDTGISLLDRAGIEAAALSHFEQLVSSVPNMNFSGEGSRARYFQLRGVGEREQYEGAPNSSTGFIVDDIDLSGIGGTLASFDLEQVEVLRGPQSTRYGSSALAGMVYVQTAMPAQEFSAQAEVMAANAGTRAVGFALGGGLHDKLSGRMSVHEYRDDGFRRNAFLGRDDTNRRKERTLRGKLNWDIGDDWQALLAAAYLDFANGYDAFSLDNDDLTYSDEPGADRQKTKAASLRVTGPWQDWAEFVSISSIAHTAIEFAYDGDWVNEDFWLPVVYDFRYRNPRDRESLSQEIRWVSRPAGRLLRGSTDWVVGLYARRLQEDNEIDSTGDYIEAAVGCDPGFCVTDRQIASRYRADNLAMFFGLDARLSHRLGLSAGLRAEHWDADYADDWLDNGVFGGPVRARNHFAPSETMLGGHLALSYEWPRGTRSYARIARGFKAGGFNPSLASLGASPNAPGPEFVTYAPEFLWNYELGTRAQSRDGGLIGEFTVFYMDRDDAQMSQSEQTDLADPNTFVFVTGNGAASVYGVEASLQWRFNDRWRFDGLLGLLGSDIDAWSVRESVVGRDLAHAPNYTLSLGASWTGANGWFARFDTNVVDGFYFDISHDQKSKDYWLANLRFGKRWDAWSVALWGRNVFDQNYATRGFYFGNEPPAFTQRLYTKFGDPRQLGISVAYQY